MLLSVFENYVFLQSLGWGIANSFWQAALLLLLYRIAIAGSNRSSALFRYHLSLFLLLASFAWFVSTVVQNCLHTKNAGSAAPEFSWLKISENFSQSLQWLSVAYFILLSMQIFLFLKKLNSVFLLQNSVFIKAPVTFRIFTEQTAFQIGIHKKISIWLSEKATVPSVIGFFKPVILLPVSAFNNLTQAQAEAVILHELAHIRRNDYLVNLLQCTVEMLLFFNPFAKMLGNIVRKERENCCDDWVLNYQYNKHDYAAALMLLEEHRFASVQLAQAATDGSKNLLCRVKRLFAAEPSVQFSVAHKLKMLSASFAILFTILLVLPVANKKSNNLAHTMQEIMMPPVSTSSVSKPNQVKTIKIAEAEKSSPVAVRHHSPKQKPSINRQAHTQDEYEFITTLINEELLKQKGGDIQPGELYIPVGNIDANTPHKVYIKVEEEKSGTKDNYTYYIELSNNNGVPVLKPLVISKKLKENTVKNKHRSHRLKTVRSRTTT